METKAPVVVEVVVDMLLLVANLNDSLAEDDDMEVVEDLRDEQIEDLPDNMEHLVADGRC